MQIQKNTVVSLDYKLTEDNSEGSLIEETFGNKPLQFIYGIGMMIPAFEENIEGKSAGDEVAFGIEAENAYGVPEEEAIIDIAIEHFAVDGKIDRDKLVLGEAIQMQDQQGNVHYGKITKVGIDKITVDFNHPMAGHNLYFQVKIKEVREATDSELDHGHVHE